MRIESKWSQGGKKLFAYVWKDRSAKTCANSIKNDFKRLYVMGKRLNYIDNLRSITVFLNIVCHKTKRSH